MIYKRGILILCCVVFICGCKTLQCSIEDQPRVDQDIHGNQGYLEGFPREEDLSQKKNTRKVISFEVKDNGEIPVWSQIKKVDDWMQENLW